MIRSLFFIVVAAALIYGAVWLADRPGDVVLDWLGWHIEMPVPFLIAVVVTIAAIAALFYRGWKWLTAVPGEIADWRRESKREKGYRALTQGMVAVAAGDAQEAQKQARRADVLLNEPPLTMLLSAQAAQLDGDDAAAKRYFTAMLEREETAFLGLRGLLIQARREGNDGEALRLAGRARQLQPKTPWVLRTLFELQMQEGQWRQALGTLDDAAKRGGLEPAEAAKLRIVVLLGCSHEAEELGNPDQAIDFAKKAQRGALDSLAATLRYAQLLAAGGKTRALEKLVRDAWIRIPHPELARLYRDAHGETKSLAAIKRLEKLIDANKDHIESHLALARAYLAAEIWGAARSHLESACKAAPDQTHPNGEAPARVCRLMAELEEREHQDMEAVRRWLMRAAIAAPDPAWICSDCGAQSVAWTPLCARCEAPGTLDWRVPDHVHALPAGSWGDPDRVALTSEVIDGAEIDDPPPIPPRIVGVDKD